MPPTARIQRHMARTDGAAAAAPWVYVLKDDWLEVLAGDDAALRGADGTPMATIISVEAGLDRTHLTQVKNGQLKLSLKVFAALVNFLESSRGFTEEQARAALFDRVPQAHAERAATRAAVA